MDEQTLREKAWIGDAVLSLYARQWILSHAVPLAMTRAEVFSRLTSNQFLSGIGEPTRVEAEIGSIYEHEGLAAAFAHIETRILPLFLKQLDKLQRSARGSRSSSL